MAGELRAPESEVGGNVFTVLFAGDMGDAQDFLQFCPQRNCYGTP